MVNEVIRRKREQLSWTQEDLGNKVGLSKSAICKIETGINDVNTNMLAKFAKVFNCNMSDFFKES